jgi:predicted nucleic acid-binding protein
MRSQCTVQSTQMLAVLSRACRIALMEAVEAASLDEIRSRIDRRGSFTFSDSGIAEAAIVQTLSIMRDNGEIRDVRNGDHALWQRVHPAKESEG